MTEACTQERTRLFRFRAGHRLLYAWACSGHDPTMPERPAGRSSGADA